MRRTPTPDISQFYIIQGQLCRVLERPLDRSAEDVPESLPLWAIAMKVQVKGKERIAVWDRDKWLFWVKPEEQHLPKFLHIRSRNGRRVRVEVKEDLGYQAGMRAARVGYADKSKKGSLLVVLDKDGWRHWHDRKDHVSGTPLRSLYSI